jgi:PAS domain S-box-containing protein
MALLNRHGVRQALFGGNRLARRLLLAIVAFSSCVTTAITVVELYAEYRRDLSGIANEFQFIRDSYVPSLSKGVWEFDDNQVRAQLEGLLRLTDVEQASIEAEGSPGWSAGTRRSRRVLSMQAELVHHDARGTQRIGTLHVLASEDEVLGRILDHALSELLRNGLKTMLVAGFVLVLFQAWVTRHLARVADYAGALDPDAPAAGRTPLALDRAPNPPGRTDILDVVVDALNRLRTSLDDARERVEQSHARLQDSELRLRLAVEAAGAGIWDCDFARGALVVNEDAARILGERPPATIAGLASWRTHVHPDDRQRIEADCRRLLDSGDQVFAEVRLRHPALGWRWFSFRGRVAERGPDGAPARALGTVVDITLRRREQEIVRANETRLRALTRQASALIYELDDEGRVIFANRQGDPQERPVVGSLARDWIPAPEVAAFDALLARVRTEGGRHAMEVAIARAPGPPRHYRLVVTPMHGEHAARVLVTATDVTELRAAQAGLEEANRTLERRVQERTAALIEARGEADRASQAKSEFLSRMSHELRTPMSAILGFAQLLEMSDLGPQELRWTSEIRSAGDHLLRLIDELLDVARIEAGKLSVRLEPCDVHAVAAEAASLCAAQARSAGIALDLGPPGAARWALADRTRLRQVLVNLLSNAIKYNRPDGRVVVRAGEGPGGRIRLSVADTGLGMSPAQQQALFTPFERLGREHGGPAGTGIGLALSKRLAELMDGRLEVQSTLGAGSTFTLSLPASARGGADAAGVDAPPVRLERPLRVLYIEDDRANRSLMQEFFAHQPRLTWWIAPDGATGLRIARRERPDVVLTDLQLPGMSGFGILAALKADVLTRAIPVVAVTGDAIPDNLARVRASAFAACLVKPLQLDGLLATLRDVAAAASVTAGSS